MKQHPRTQICAWRDSGICLCISTRHHVEDGFVLRRVSGNRERIVRDCPKLIQDYNSFMGGVDRADALRAHLSTMRKVQKCWNSLMYWILDTALINCQILYQDRFFLLQFSLWIDTNEARMCYAMLEVGFTQETNTFSKMEIH